MSGALVLAMVVAMSALINTANAQNVTVLEPILGEVSGGSPCLNDTVCNADFAEPHGQCNFTNVPPQCECYPPYAGTQCERVRKSQRTTFILSFLLGPYGTDRFYLGYTGLAIAKLVLSLLLCGVPCFPICLTLCRRKKVRHDGGGPKKTSVLAPCALFFLAYAGVIVWWLHDWIQILLGALPDAQGVNLFADLIQEK